MPEVPELHAFASRATAGIAAPAERAGATSELYEHALSAYEEHRASGLAHDDAVEAALTQLGEPSEYRKDFARAHRARLTPRTVLLIGGAAIVFMILLWAFFALIFGVAS